MTVATLQQLDPTAKIYPKQRFDWRKTRIGMTQLAAATEEYGRDEALADFDRRTKLHKALDRACCQKNIIQDKAERLHARLDRLLDEQPDTFGESTRDEDEVENMSRHEVPASEISDHRSTAMDAHKCEQCRIVDNHVPARRTVALDAAQNSMAETVIRFWKQYGINLEKAGQTSSER